MISKELFRKTIADIQEQDRKISEFDHALGKICDSAVVFDADNLYLATLLRILKEDMDDKADTIEWWLYEDVRKCIWFDLEDGRRMRYDMPTAESLYDYLTLPYEQLHLEVESWFSFSRLLAQRCFALHHSFATRCRAKCWMRKMRKNAQRKPNSKEN